MERRCSSNLLPAQPPHKLEPPTRPGETRTGNCCLIGQLVQQLYCFSTSSPDSALGGRLGFIFSTDSWTAPLVRRLGFFGGGLRKGRPGEKEGDLGRS